MKVFKKVKPFIGLIALIIIPLVFFYPFLLQGKLPMPSDTIIGLYHPFRDLYAENYPNGIPYKNFLLTDPVRQQYPWKEFAITSLKSGSLPIWNPYEMSGKPQLANFQTGVFYPLNILLFISPFYLSWSFFILLQPLLAGIFMYLYLKNLRINTYAAFLGGLCFSFSGFMVAWLEWGVVGHTYLWLPLILLSIDKGFFKQDIKWKLMFIFSLSSSFFAGHLQVFTYVFLVALIYFLLRLFKQKKKARIIFSFVFDLGIFLLTASIQWIPTLMFILNSSRSTDQTFLQPGWFIPWQNLSMFIVPDFFGNPSTLNYYGVWNYAEFVGYIGITGAILALYAAIFRRDRKTLFFVACFLLALLFSTPNIISKIPFFLNIPFFSTAQPTRLIGIMSFSFAILAALGLDLFIKKRSKIWVSNCIIGAVLVLLFFLSSNSRLFPSESSAAVAQNNLKLPLLLFLSSVVVLFFIHTFKNEKAFKFFIIVLLLINLLDLFRFGWKFTPFTEKEYLFPETKTLQFLQKNVGNSRIAVLDDRILPPNFQTVYKIPSITGYDPLYLTNYAQLIAANERQDHSINPPFGYNRIITPKNYNTQIFDLLNVKYILSLDLLDSPKLKLVSEEGQTKIYQNSSVFPLAFFVKNVESGSREQIAKQIFKSDLLETAFVNNSNLMNQYNVGIVKILKNTNNSLTIETNNAEDGFLILSQIYYPEVLITVDGNRTKFYESNLALIGLEIPIGKHMIQIKRKLF